MGAALPSPTQRKVVIFRTTEPETIGAKEMSRISFMLLIVMGLALTAYFGTAAWRLTDDSHLDATGQIPHGIRWRGGATVSQFRCWNDYGIYRGFGAELFSRGAEGLFWSANAVRLAMDPFEKKRLLPVEVMIVLAINVVVAIFGYYAIMMWGLVRG
jgi:hypothetical protein